MEGLAYVLEVIGSHAQSLEDQVKDLEDLVDDFTINSMALCKERDHALDLFTDTGMTLVNGEVKVNGVVYYQTPEFWPDSIIHVWSSPELEDYKA